MNLKTYTLICYNLLGYQITYSVTTVPGNTRGVYAQKDIYGQETRVTYDSGKRVEFQFGTWAIWENDKMLDRGTYART